MTTDIITAIDQLYALRPTAAALANRLDDDRDVTDTEIQAIYDSERVASQALAAAITAAAVGDVDRVELADACSLIAATLSGVGDLSQRWEDSPAAREAQIARAVEMMLADGIDADEIATIIATDRADTQ